MVGVGDAYMLKMVWDVTIEAQQDEKTLLLVADEPDSSTCGEPDRKRRESKPHFHR